MRSLVDALRPPDERMTRVAERTTVEYKRLADILGIDPYPHPHPHPHLFFDRNQENLESGLEAWRDGEYAS